MKVLFLDIDGVLTTVLWHGFYKFNPVCTKTLKIILDLSGYKIVISSAWRGYNLNIPNRLDRELTSSGLKQYLHKDWKTDHIDGPRGYEIKDWLDAHPDITEYIILDDESDMLPEQKPRFIQTDTYDGLLFEHAEKLVKLTGIDDVKYAERLNEI